MIQIIAKPQLYTVGDTQYLLTQGRDLISSHLKAGQRWEGFVVDLIAMYLSRIEKPVFVDIGANLGAISVPIAQFLQPRGGQVHSIEAQRAVFYQLCGNIFANNVRAKIVLPITPRWAITTVKSAFLCWIRITPPMWGHYRWIKKSAPIKANGTNRNSKAMK